jgi:hypothetical protein
MLKVVVVTGRFLGCWWCDQLDRFLNLTPLSYFDGCSPVSKEIVVVLVIPETVQIDQASRNKGPWFPPRLKCDSR